MVRTQKVLEKEGYRVALFKILRGDSSNISTSKTKWTDGYAYFTPDDGGFYIDATVGKTEKRIRVNPASTVVNGTLTAAGWKDGLQTLAVTGMTASSNGLAGVAQDMTDEQLEAVEAASLYVCGQGNGTLTVCAYGKVPAEDIPVVVVLLP
jgi:hypothetical protein